MKRSSNVGFYGTLFITTAGDERRRDQEKVVWVIRPSRKLRNGAGCCRGLRPALTPIPLHGNSCSLSIPHRTAPTV